MTLTATQERIVEAAMDATFKGSDQDAADYAIDQLVNGGSPEYHEAGERPERDPRDVRLLVEALKARLRRIGIVFDETTPNAPRTYAADLQEMGLRS